MATIVHFDISAENQEKVKKFYEDLFQWKINLLPGSDNYYMIETSDLNGAKGIGGGISKRTSKEQAGITNFIGVPSIDKLSDKIVKAGGNIIQTKQAVPGYGFLAVCTDPENNIFGIFEEVKTMDLKKVYDESYLP